MKEVADFQKCFICHDKTENEKIQRRAYVRYFCRLFNLPESPFEDRLFHEAFFCFQCLGNIDKIEQLYRKLENVQEEIVNYRNLFENQITGKRPPTKHGNKDAEDNKSKLVTEISPDNVSDTSEKLRTAIINKIQFVVVDIADRSKKNISAAGSVDHSEEGLNCQNLEMDSINSEEIHEKVEAETDWSPPSSPFTNDNSDEYSDNDESQRDSDYSYSKNNNSEHRDIFRRTTRSQTTTLQEPTRNRTTVKKKLVKGKGRRKARSTADDQKEKPLKEKSSEKAGSSVNWMTCSRENCKFRFRDENQLTTHIKRYHEGMKKPHVCPQPGCGKAFRSRSIFEQHQFTHTGLKSFVCEFCAKSYFTKQLLTSHVNRIHLKKFPLHCSICSKGIRSKPELDVHMLQHKDKTPFECHCGKRFSSPFYLKSHQLAHNEEFKCLLCEKSFGSKFSLKEHNFQHNGLYPFNCTQCDYGTRQKNHLRMHMDAHNGIKVQCNVCDKKVSERGLAKHKKIHDSERDKPFVCEHCGKGFVDRHKLKCHAIIHTGEKPFQCEICGKGANTRGNLTKHMKCHEKATKNDCI